MKLWMIAFRAIFAYFYLLLIVRLSGKRTVGQATPLDFVTALILGDMIDDLLWAEVPAAMFVVGTAGVVLSHIAVSLLCARNPSVRRLMEGSATPVAAGGSPQEQGLKRERIHPLGLMEMLRGFRVRDMRATRQVQVEIDGAPSLLYADWAHPVTREDWRHHSGMEGRP